MKITNASPSQSPDTNSSMNSSNDERTVLSPEDLQANLNQGIAKAMGNIDQILAAVQNSQDKGEMNNLQLQAAMDDKTRCRKPSPMS